MPKEKTMSLIFFPVILNKLIFEYECPNPIWWFDYTNQVPPTKELRLDTETPDVELIRNDILDNDHLTIELLMIARSEFKDYAIALWDLPEGYVYESDKIETNAKDCIIAENAEGKRLLVLVFDLKPDVKIQIKLERY